MSCPDCQQAQSVKHWSGYHATCRGCEVRAIASGPAYFSALQANAITGQYRAALQAFFGEQWKQVHEEVKAEHLRLKGMK